MILPCRQLRRQQRRQRLPGFRGQGGQFLGQGEHVRGQNRSNCAGFRAAFGFSAGSGRFIGVFGVVQVQYRPPSLTPHVPKRRGASLCIDVLTCLRSSRWRVARRLPREREGEASRYVTAARGERAHPLRRRSPCSNRLPASTRRPA